MKSMLCDQMTIYSAETNYCIGTNANTASQFNDSSSNHPPSQATDGFVCQYLQSHLFLLKLPFHYLHNLFLHELLQSVQDFHVLNEFHIWK